VKAKKLRKVVFLDESVAFLKELNRSSTLVNKVLKQVFTGSTSENLALALDIIHGRRTITVQVSGAPMERSLKAAEDPEKEKDSRIKVTIKNEKKAGKEEKGSRLLDDLSRMAKEFGE